MIIIECNYKYPHNAEFYKKLCNVCLSTFIFSKSEIRGGSEDIRITCPCCGSYLYPFTNCEKVEDIKNKRGIYT